MLIFVYLCNTKKIKIMKNKIIPIRFTEIDYSLLVEESNKIGLSVSALIRMIVLQKFNKNGKKV